MDLTPVPGRVHLRDRARPARLEALDETGVDRPAEAREPVRLDAERCLEDALLLVDRLRQVGERLGVEALAVDVDVDPAGSVGASAGGVERANDVLELLEIPIGEHRADDLRVVVAAQAPIGNGPPHAPVGGDRVPGAVGLGGDERASLGATHVQAGNASQPEMRDVCLRAVARELATCRSRL